MKWNTGSHAFSSAFSIGLLIASVIFPFLIITLLLKCFDKLDSETVSARIGSLYEGLRIKSKWALMYNSFFIGRRLIFAFIIVLLKEYQALQVIFFFYQCLAVFVYIIHAKPFDDSQLNKIEFFNEACILITAYHLLVFTDFIPDDETYDSVRFAIGISMVVVTAINVIVNTSIMIGKTCKKIRNSCRRIRYNLNVLKTKKKLEEINNPAFNDQVMNITLKLKKKAPGYNDSAPKKSRIKSIIERFK